jgi:hypothetical protein
MRLAGILLEMAADEFGNHGCNDFKLPPMPETAVRDLLTEYYAPDPIPDLQKKSPILNDAILMSLMAKKLLVYAGP